MIESSFDEMQRGTLRRCLGVIEVFDIRVRKYLPMKLAKTFMYVALFEGIDLETMCDLTAETQSTISHHLRKLGNGTKGRRGLDLIESYPNPDYRRRHIDYKLTSDGRTLAKRIIAAMEES